MNKIKLTRFTKKLLNHFKLKLNAKRLFFLTTVFVLLNLTIFFKDISQAADVGFTKIKKFYQGQRIFETRQVEDGHAEGHMKELAQFYGKMAECNCKEWNDEGECEEYMTYDERKICNIQYPFWEPGTFKLAGSLAIEGAHVLLNGIDTDNAGYHWIMTSPYEIISNTIGLLRDSYAVYFRGNIYVAKDLDLNINNSTIYLNNNSEEKIYEEDGGLYFYMKDDENALEVKNSSVDFHQGLEVTDYLKSDEMIFNNSRTIYCDLSNDLGKRWDVLGCLNLTEDQIANKGCACVNGYTYQAYNEDNILTDYTINRGHTENFIYKQ